MGDITSPFLRRLRHRLRNNFQLAILMLIGGVAVFGIAPFAIYRFATGNMLAGVVDTLIVAFILGALVFAWRSDRTTAAGAFVSVTSSIGCLAVALVMGLSGLLWMYVALLANYLLLAPRYAVLASVVVLGVLAAHGGPFDSRMTMVMFLSTASVTSLFAYIFASRMQAQRLQLEELASRDALTGAHNRRAMEAELELAVELMQRERRPYGLAVLDLDHFKNINDAHGHEVGDQALQKFAQLVRANTRRVDRFFRYGGEEFVVLLPGADESALGNIAELVRRKVAEGLQVKGRPVTVSIGAAELLQGEPWQAWLARADAALYRAKHAGRDRIEVDRATAAMRATPAAVRPREAPATQTPPV